MRIYLADLTHDYLPQRQYTPLGIGHIAAYLDSIFPGQLELRLFKSVESLLDATDAARPDLVGLSNYIWNVAITRFAGRQIKAADPRIPVVMGGPNIRTDPTGVESFLREYEFVDVYCMFAGERSFGEITRQLLELPHSSRTGDALREFDVDSCYSLRSGTLTGNSTIQPDKDLDFIPSTYTAGWMDPFLDAGCIPIIETNRGCPYSCTFCVWGIAALNKLNLFSMERVQADLDYVAHYGATYPSILFADANFGIVKRDVDISRHVRAIYEETKSFALVEFYWTKSLPDYMVQIADNLGHLTHNYMAVQSFDPDVLKASKRSNIKLDRMVELSERINPHTFDSKTDILLGLPNETVQSHLASLEKAMNLGFYHIHGGEIRMLPGSELDTLEQRQRYDILTKFRLYEGCAGIYQGELVYELEEVVRQTNTMSEDEMIYLRVFRAIFYGIVTLGEHRPLVEYLMSKGILVTDIIKDLCERGLEHPDFSPAIRWLHDYSTNEWFDTPESAAKFFEDPRDQANLFNTNAFVRLNYGFLARLLLNPSEHRGFYQLLEEEVLVRVPADQQAVVIELLRFCWERNYLRRCLAGDQATAVELEIGPQTRTVLADMGYLSRAEAQARDEADGLTMRIEEVVGMHIRDKVAKYGGSPTIMNVSQIMQLFVSRFYLQSVGARSAPKLGSIARAEDELKIREKELQSI